MLDEKTGYRKSCEIVHLNIYYNTDLHSSFWNLHSVNM